MTAADAVDGTVFIPPGTWKIASLITVPNGVSLIGCGSTSSILQATAAAAGVKFGGSVGGTTTRHGPSGGWSLDGNSLSTVGVSTNTVNVVFTDISIAKVAGDSFQALGQNNVFNRVNSSDCSGDAVVVDNGAGGNVFLNLSVFTASGYHLTIKRSAAPTAGAYNVPTSNIFYSPILEQGGSTTFGGTADGCVHHTAGTFNYIYTPSFYMPETASPCVYLEKDASNNTNGRLYIINGIFTGAGGASTASGIEANVVVAGVAGALNTDYAVVLQGENVFSGLDNGIKWGTSTPIVNQGTKQLCFSTSPAFVTNGTGASQLYGPELDIRLRMGNDQEDKLELFDGNGTPANRYGIGTDTGELNLYTPLNGKVAITESSSGAEASTGTVRLGLYPNGFIEGTEITDPGAPAADAGRLYFKDVAGRSKLYKRDSTAVTQILDADDAGLPSAPTGPAGGALDGTYPNPGIANSVAGIGLQEASDVLSFAQSANFRHRQALLSLGPGLLWTLGSSGGTDLSNNARTGTAAGGVTIGGYSTDSPTLGDNGAATDLDGTDDRITSTYNPFVNGTVRTYMGWANRDSTAADDCIFAGSAAGLLSPELFVASGGNNVVWYPDPSAGAATTWTSAWKTGRWMHWALVFSESGDSVSLYIDGTPVSTQTTTVAYNAAPGNLVLGAYGSTVLNPFNGKMAHFAVYERGLTAAEIRNIYESGVQNSPWTPYYLNNDTFTVPSYKQVPFTEPIELAGTSSLVVDGILSDVGTSQATVAAQACAPLSVSDGSLFVVPSNSQMMWSEPISVDGTGNLAVDGLLVDITNNGVF